MAAAKGNLYAVGNQGGRPPIYDSVEVLTSRIDEYFTGCLAESGTEWAERPTVTGLALFLGFESRKTLNDYAKKDGFSYPVRRALMVIEQEYEKMLPTAKGSGVIFALKNMGWEDKSTVEKNVSLKSKPDWLTATARPKPIKSDS